MGRGFDRRALQLGAEALPVAPGGPIFAPLQRQLAQCQQGVVSPGAAESLIDYALEQAAVALGVAVNVIPHDVTLRVLATAVAVVVVVRHRTNIKRIVSGTESRL